MKTAEVLSIANRVMYLRAPEAHPTGETGSICDPETYVTQHVTRGRLKKLALILALQDRIDDVVAVLETHCKNDKQRAEYLDLLCLKWFGPIFPKPPRSDRGGWHWLAKPVRLTCQHCGGSFNARRMDARFCRNACRQAAYSQRNRSLDYGDRTSQ